MNFIMPDSSMKLAAGDKCTFYGTAPKLTTYHYVISTSFEGPKWLIYIMILLGVRIRMNVECIKDVK